MSLCSSITGSGVVASSPVADSISLEFADSSMNMESLADNLPLAATGRNCSF